jgi:hypothetical protein
LGITEKEYNELLLEIIVQANEYSRVLRESILNLSISDAKDAAPHSKRNVREFVLGHLLQHSYKYRSGSKGE